MWLLKRGGSGKSLVNTEHREDQSFGDGGKRQQERRKDLQRRKKGREKAKDIVIKQFEKHFNI